MKRATASVALLLLMALPAPSSGASSFSLSAGDARFPDRSYVLTLPQRMALTQRSVHVLENRGPVSALRVVPLNAGKEQFGVVLVIDASGSMRGQAIQRAAAAAREFAAQRPPSQPLGLLSFNDAISVDLPLSTDATKIDSKLAGIPQTHGNTRAYDAVVKALQAIKDSGAAGGAVVLLSDGQITRTATTADDVVAEAHSAHVVIYTVGLRSAQLDPTQLRALSTQTGGSYSQAASSLDLGEIYRKLGVRLASGYLLKYRSHASEGERITVEARVKGLPGAATTSYVAPVIEPVGTSRASSKSGFWGSTAAVVIVSLLGALVIGLVFLISLRGGRGTTLRERMARFVSLPQPEERRRPTEAVADRLVAGTSRSLRGSRWWLAFVEDVDIARMDMDPAQIAVGGAFATLLAGALLVVASGEWLLALAAVVVPFAVVAYIRARADKQREAFNEQLADDLAIIASAMRAGHSFVGALSAVVEQAAEPSKREFQRVVADERLGAPLDQAVESVVIRMRNPDLEQVALLATLQRETGASAAEMIDRVIETIRERQMLRRMVRALTAQGRMSRWVLTVIPVFLLVFLTLSNPDYVDPLYHTAGGKLLLVLGAIMVAAGSYVIKRIVEFEI